MPDPFLIDETAEPQTLDEILDWHRGIVESLLEQRASVQRSILLDLTTSARFVDISEIDIEIHFDAQRRELDRLTIFNLVASVEASIRLDYSRRVKGKLKDPVSMAYRTWHKTLSNKKRIRPDFDRKGILRVVKDADVMDNNVIGQYRACLRVRHWVGHGRYWTKPKEVDGLTPVNVYDRCQAILQTLLA